MHKKTEIKRAAEKLDNKYKETVVRVIRNEYTKSELRQQIKMAKDGIKRCDSQIANIMAEKAMLEQSIRDREEMLSEKYENLSIASLLDWFKSRF